jgi:peptide deformylase
MKILTINNKKEEKFLRQKTAEFDFNKYTKKEIDALIKEMKKTMLENNGIGLSANQVGLDLNFFVAEIPADISINPRLNQHKSASNKFYAIFNPEIIKFSENKSIMEEGCLSVPNVYGLVERPEKITLIGYDKNAKKIKIKAWGLLARVFQHEIDHLNGILFIDKVKELYKVTSKQQTENRV